MSRNVEIKARARRFDEQRRLAAGLANGRVEHLVQEDTFFNVPTGRLKLRVFGDGSGELIQYNREDSLQPKESRYVCSPISDPKSLKEAVANSIGIRGIVRKKRTVYLCGQTRIHFDEVEELGAFVELEVVLKPDEDFAHAEAIAQGIMAKLEISANDLIAEAYIDLLEKNAEEMLKKC